MSLKKQTVNSLKWQVSVSLIQKIITFGATIILARHLGPSVFGLFGLTLVIVSSFELFKSMGIDAALIQRRNDFKEATDTAFLIIPTFAIMLYIILTLSAPAIGKFLNNRELVHIVRVLGLVFVINAFTKVPLALLERNMQFKETSITEFTGAMLFSLSAIIFAFLNYGVWSLVYAYIIKMFTTMIMLWRYAKWKPNFKFNKIIAIEMFNFGKFVFLGCAIWFLKTNLDNILVGKLLGTTVLGLYAVAFNIANFGVDYFGSRIYKVFFPAYSKLQDDLVGLRSAVLKAIKYISVIALPLGAGIFILGNDFLLIAYGQKWIAAANVLKVLALGGIFNTLPTCIEPVFLALGKTKIGFWASLIQVTLFFIFITPAAKLFGLIGIGFVVTFASLFAMLFYFYWAKKLLALKMKQIFQSLKLATTGSLLMVLGVIFAKNISLLSSQNIFLTNKFILLFCLAIVIYLYSLFKIDKKFFLDVKMLIFN